MGERKVLNQYYPPDFDPSKLPRVKRAEANMLKVRCVLLRGGEERGALRRLCVRVCVCACVCVRLAVRLLRHLPGS